jgi:serpin B
MTQSRLSVLALFAFAPALACGSGGAGGAAPDGAAPVGAVQKSTLPRDTAPSVPAADAAQLAAGNQAFAVDVYRQLRTQPGNLIFSPTSLSVALAMLYNGAANGTAAEMASALHFTLPLPGLNAAFDAMDLALTTPPADATAFQLSIANSLWAQKGFVLEQPFLDALATSFGAGVNMTDFLNAPETARADINGWVSDQTHGGIPMLFDQGSIDAGTRLVLVDAVYFHGDWQSPFAPHSPNGTFHAAAGDVTVPIMTGPDVQLWSGAGWNAAALPYKGGTTQMVLVVPDAGNFDTFEQGLTSDQLTAILAGQGNVGPLSMPRFKFGFGAKLNQVLATLGMPDAFTSAADFSGIDGQRDLAVQAVVHQADIAVDEQGTTASAATGISVGVTGVPQHSLRVDRPFLFFIVHQPTGAILFAGRVLDPTAS